MQIGDTLNNRYTVTAHLGSGAMGEVYQATDSQTNQLVAVKVLDHKLTLDPEMVERFRREGEALRQLRHRHIVSFVDTFPHERQQVIVMEHVGGGSLHQLIRRGSLPVEQARQIAIDLCDALTSAHRLNIIHRDFKPENVLMAADGTPKLTDFGVARLVGAGTGLTGTGTQIGTPYYMSPEAWEGQPVDARADIWSLGIVLYEMLTGEVPFGGDTLVAVMNKVLTAPLPDLKKLRPETPPALVKIVRRMLERDPAKRYQSLREVALDLERTPAAPQAPAPPISYQPPAPAQETPRPATTQRAVLPRAVFILGGIGGLLLLGILLVVAFDSALPAVTMALTPPLGLGSTPVSPVDSMVQVYVPAGEFLMGSTDNDPLASPNEKPQHTVYLDAFWIARTEVTNAMYALCVAAGACQHISDTSSYTRSSYYGNSQYDNYPVIKVSWNDAHAYCTWAGRRLPTEAEWEKAARGTDGRVYPWGNEGVAGDLLNFADVNLGSGDYDKSVNDGYADTAPVGNYPGGASPYGALDMAGNVAEWVADWYDENYYANSPSQNPSGPSSGSTRVLRDGSWSQSAWLARATFRSSDWLPGAQLDFVGFRCAR